MAGGGAQGLPVQLSQTLSSAIAQIKVSNSPITNHTKKTLPRRPPPFVLFVSASKTYIGSVLFRASAFTGA